VNEALSEARKKFLKSVNISINLTHDPESDGYEIEFNATEPISTVTNILILAEYEKDDEYIKFNSSSITMATKNSFRILTIKVSEPELEEICKLTIRDSPLIYSYNCSVLFTLLTTENKKPFIKFYSSLEMEINGTTHSIKPILSPKSVSSLQNYTLRPDIASQLEFCNDTSCSSYLNNFSAFQTEETLILSHFLQEEGDRNDFYLSLISLKLNYTDVLLDYTHAAQSLCQDICDNGDNRIQFSLPDDMHGEAEIRLMSQLHVKNQRRNLEDSSQNQAISQTKVIYVVREGMSIQESKALDEMLQVEENEEIVVKKNYGYLWILIPVLVFILLALGGAGAILVRMKKKQHQKLDEDVEIPQIMTTTRSVTETDTQTTQQSQK
jgi:hypothetical protein